MNSRLEIELAPEDLALLRLLASDDESVEATASRHHDGSGGESSDEHGPWGLRETGR